MGKLRANYLNDAGQKVRWLGESSWQSQEVVLAPEGSEAVRRYRRSKRLNNLMTAVGGVGLAVTLYIGFHFHFYVLFPALFFGGILSFSYNGGSGWPRLPVTKSNADGHRLVEAHNAVVEASREFPEEFGSVAVQTHGLLWDALERQARSRNQDSSEGMKALANQMERVAAGATKRVAELQAEKERVAELVRQDLAELTVGDLSTDPLDNQVIEAGLLADAIEATVGKDEETLPREEK
jgi:hypothetical protein